MGSAYRHYWKGHFVRDGSPGLVDAVTAAHDAGTSAGGILIETIHGMAHRIPDQHAAFGARSAVANVSALGIWNDPAEDDRHVSWVRETAASLEPYSLRGGGYLNYAPADETAGRVERAFGGERFARLRAVKRRCDPDNRFRFDANIPPG
jgi:FAD/FMN-containing dehydrogenase